MATPPTITWTPGIDWDTSDTAASRSVTVSATAGDRIVFIVVGENGNNISWSTPFPSTDGAQLTWTSAFTPFIGIVPNDQCFLGMWTATVDTTRSIVITSQPGRNATSMAWGVGAWVASGSDGIGNKAFGDNGTGSGATSLAITTEGDNSAIVCINADWNASSGARTYRQVNSANPVEDRYDGTAGTNYIVEAFRYTDTGSAGAKTVGLTSPSSQRYIVGAVEIKGSAGTPASGPLLLESGGTLLAEGGGRILL